MTNEQREQTEADPIEPAVASAIDRLNEIAKMGDTEAAHIEADDALLVFLHAVGYGDVADAWAAAQDAHMGFWYS